MRYAVVMPHRCARCFLAFWMTYAEAGKRQPCSCGGKIEEVFPPYVREYDDV